MFSHQTKIRVRYAETDKMGYVYYGNYATYFEVARVEALRSLGVNYKEMEDSGIMLPVLSYSTKFYKPAFYDEELTIKLFIKEMPKARIHFFFETYNTNDIKINEAEVTLVFVDIQKNKPCSAPQNLINQLKSFGI
ncbi:acyl-CoA thioesterase [Flavobacteriales bacterium]|nr:acyl-CoA thioesterase [Flavobacteriales bacterium]